MPEDPTSTDRSIRPKGNDKRKVEVLLRGIQGWTGRRGSGFQQPAVGYHHVVNGWAWETKHTGATGREGRTDPRCCCLVPVSTPEARTTVRRLAHDWARPALEVRVATAWRSKVRGAGCEVVLRDVGDKRASVGVLGAGVEGAVGGGGGGPVEAASSCVRRLWAPVNGLHTLFELGGRTELGKESMIEHFHVTSSLNGDKSLCLPSTSE